MFTTTALVLLLCAATPAEEASAKAKVAFKEGQKLYTEGRFPEAIDKFEEAYAAKPHPVISFNIGRCYDQLGDNPKALRAYRDYLKAQPDAKDKAEVAALIAALEKKLQAQGVQQLLVYTEPAGAVVFIDGKARGSSPASVELRPGNHTAQVTKDGHENSEKPFTMPADKSMELSFALKPKAGGVAQDASKNGATVAAADPKSGTAGSTAGTTTTATTTAGTTTTATTTAGATTTGATTTGTTAAAGTTTASTTPAVSKAPPAKSGGLRKLVWIPAAGGVVLLGVGAACYGIAKGTEGRLRSGDPTLAVASTRSSAISGGQTMQAAGFALGGVGIAALAAAGVMFFLPTSSGSKVAARVTPSIGGAVVSGEFP